MRLGFKWLQSLDAIIIDNVRVPEAVTEFTEYEYEIDKQGTSSQATHRDRKTTIWLPLDMHLKLYGNGGECNEYIYEVKEFIYEPI